MNTGGCGAVTGGGLMLEREIVEDAGEGEAFVVRGEDLWSENEDKRDRDE